MSIKSRRDFIKFLGTGTLSTSLARILRPQAPTSLQSQNSFAAFNPPRIQKYNPLGKTGIKVSEVSFGAINLLNPNVMQYAYECGVNYFDTAEGYGLSERLVGQALKGIRNKVSITSKHLLRGPQDKNKESMIKRVEESLKKLETDYLDIAMLHAIDNPKNLEIEDLLNAYSELKKEGKVRHVGFSTHNAKETLKKALEIDFYEVALVIYNHLEGSQIEPLLAEAHKKGIGTIAMKVFAGNLQGSLKSLIAENTPYSQAAIRWVLSSPSVDCCIVTMTTFSHVEDYVAASGKKLNRADLKVISRYQCEAKPLYCRVSCRECLSSCPKGVAVNDILRYAMYFQHYGMEKKAMGLYAGLKERQKPLNCDACAAPCQSACPFGLKVKERLLYSHKLLA
jgi:aryl-alcohol dehydrogenase-like predicted oxidoreductase